MKAEQVDNYIYAKDLVLHRATRMQVPAPVTDRDDSALSTVPVNDPLIKWLQSCLRNMLPADACFYTYKDKCHAVLMEREITHIYEIFFFQEKRTFQNAFKNHIEFTIFFHK